MGGEPLVIVESIRQVDELAHVELGKLAFQERLLQVQLGVAGSLALALLATRLPRINKHYMSLSTLYVDTSKTRIAAAYCLCIRKGSFALATDCL